MNIIKKTLSIEPNQSSGWEIVWKFFIGLLVWWIISVLLFIILSFVWSIFTESMWQTWEFAKSNPILPLLLLLIWFISSFIWNLAISWIYSLFFSQKYYNTSKTMWLLLLTNWLLFIILAPIYIIFANDINILFVILGFHIIFSTFLSSNQTEIVSNPNYSASTLIGNTIGFAITILVYSIVRKSSAIWWTQEKLYLLILFPPLISFAITWLGQWIREIIYYKMYEMWNNWFYTPSINTQDQFINSNTTSNTDTNLPNNTIDTIQDDEINIDLN